MSAKRRYPRWGNPPKVLYHGTTKTHADAIIRNGIDPSRGEPNTDFGRGFYTTTNRAQAVKWAEIKASECGEMPVVLKVKIDRTALSKLRSQVFTRPTSDYWSLVERCRDKDDVPHATDQDYDVVYGPVAKRWWGPKAYKAIPNYDQTSFHGDAAKLLLNDKKLCLVEVVK